MPKIRTSTIVRRFLAGRTIEQIADDVDDSQQSIEALNHVEDCIRRGLRGEVPIDKPQINAQLEKRGRRR